MRFARAQAIDYREERTQEHRMDLLKYGTVVMRQTFNTCLKPLSDLQFSHFYDKWILFVNFPPSLRIFFLQRKLNLKTNSVTI